jgi:hypothetical protein
MKPVRAKSRVNDWGNQDRVGQLPDPKSSVEVSAAGSGNQDRVEVTARRFRNRWVNLSLTRWLIIEHLGDLSISFHHQPNVVGKGHKVAGE